MLKQFKTNTILIRHLSAIIIIIILMKQWAEKNVTTI